jgi:hypothetical protein
MGLQFTVGNPADAFLPEFAERVRAALTERFGDAVILDSAEPPYYSEECAWSGWSSLQTRAADAIDAKRAPHFLSMEAWTTGYVPADTKRLVLSFRDESTRLAIGALPALISELEEIGPALRLPTDDASLQKLARDCIEDDEMDIQVYAALLLAARVARGRRQILWVVK